MEIGEELFTEVLYTAFVKLIISEDQLEAITTQQYFWTVKFQGDWDNRHPKGKYSSEVL